MHYIIEQEFLFITSSSLIKNSLESIKIINEFSPDAMIDSANYYYSSLKTRIDLVVNQISFERYLNFQFKMHMQYIELRNKEDLQEVSNRYDNWSNKQKRLDSKQEYIEPIN